MDNKTQLNPTVNRTETIINLDILNNAAKTELNTEPYINAYDIPKGTCLLDKYTIIEPLNAVSGEADLYLCEYYGDMYVAKIYRREVAVKSEVIRAVKNIKSPYVARLFDTGTYGSRPFEILPYYKNGSLQGKTFTFEQLKDVIIPCINEALDKLHKIGVIHKDLKPSNIMMLDDNKGVAIIDFGISSVLNDGNTILVTKTGLTPEYSAPETFRNVFLEESDYYSFGITLYELFFGYTPYRNMSTEEITQYMSVQQIPIPDNISEELKNLLLGLTYNDLTNRNDVNNPNRRWTYNEVCNWIKGIDQSIPGALTGNSKSFPAYKFMGKDFNDIDSLTHALGENWNDGKKVLFRGELSEFFKHFNADYANICLEAELKLMRNGSDEDTIFYEFLYRLNPSLKCIYWRDIYFDNLNDFGVSLFDSLRKNENVANFENIISLELISKYYNIVFNNSQMASAINSLEKYIKLKMGNKSKKEVILYSLCYMILDEKKLIIDDTTFYDIQELLRYMKNLLNTSYDAYRVFCEKLIDEKMELNPHFEGWLISLGKKNEMEKWKTTVNKK